MDVLNHNHLRSFWATAREGSIAAACEMLGLSQPTISRQVGELEDTLGVALFRRVGRGLTLTDQGRHAFVYAEEILSLGNELVDAVHSGGGPKSLRFAVGVSDAVPKLLARLVLEPALGLDRPLRMHVREGTAQELLAELAVGTLDAVILDDTPPEGVAVRVHGRKLGESEVAIFGAQPLVDEFKRRFPASLEGAPVLLPAEGTAIRRTFDALCNSEGVRPRTIAEFTDSALLKSFGAAGHGLFAAPIAVEHALRQQYGVRRVGLIPGASESIYAITAERRVTHPGVAAMIEHAEHRLGGASKETTG